MELKKTKLYQRHVELAAKMTEFAGWLMPLDYGSIIEEHRRIRGKAGVFDVSHMGRVSIVGNEALEALQRLISIKVEKVQPGSAHYALLCNANGGIVDDLMLIHTFEGAFILVVNAANKDKDVAWALENTKTLDVVIEDLEDKIAILALQGPEAARILSLLADIDSSLIPKDGCGQVTLDGRTMMVSRTGYTGEDGFELFPDQQDVVGVWDCLLNAGLEPCGLGARDTLRLEAALPLYGHELSEETNPFEAGLGWVVDLGKPDFLGREALVEAKQRGPQRKLVCLEILGRNIARNGSPIYADGAEVGRITSGSFSPSLNKSIAMGYVPSGLSAPGNQLQVGIRDRIVTALIVKRPFFRGSALR